MISLAAGLARHRSMQASSRSMPTASRTPRARSRLVRSPLPQPTSSARWQPGGRASKTNSSYLELTRPSVARHAHHDCAAAADPTASGSLGGESGDTSLAGAAPYVREAFELLEGQVSLDVGRSGRGDLARELA